MSRFRVDAVQIDDDAVVVTGSWTDAQRYVSGGVMSVANQLVFSKESEVYKEIEHMMRDVGKQIKAPLTEEWPDAEEVIDRPGDRMA